MKNDVASLVQMLIKRQRAYELMMKEMSVSRRERNDSIAEEREPAEANYPNVRNSLQKSIKKKKKTLILFHSMLACFSYGLRG